MTTRRPERDYDPSPILTEPDRSRFPQGDDSDLAVSQRASFHGAHHDARWPRLHSASKTARTGRPDPTTAKLRSDSPAPETPARSATRRSPARLHRLHQTPELILYLVASKLSRTTSCDYNDVHAWPQPRACAAKPLSNPALQPIPRNRAPDPTTHRDPNPRNLLLRRVRRRHCKDDEVPLRRTRTLPGDVPEIPGTEETVRPPEAARPCTHDTTSRACRPSAAFVPCCGAA